MNNLNKAIKEIKFVAFNLGLKQGLTSGKYGERLRIDKLVLEMKKKEDGTYETRAYNIALEMVRRNINKKV